MSLDFKKLMNTKLKQVAPRYNLPEILFPSFVRRYGYKTALSASDAVHSLTSLLDYGAKWVKSYVQMDLGDMVGDAGLSSSIAVGGTNREGAGGGIMSAIHHFSASAGIYSGADHVSTRGGSGGLQAGVGVGTRTGIAAVGARLAESADSMILGFSSSRRLEDGDKEEDQEDEWMQDWVRNFYVAYDALDR